MAKRVRIDGGILEVLHHDGLQVHQCDEVLPNGQVHHYRPTRLEVEGHSFDGTFYDGVSKSLAEAVDDEAGVDVREHDIRVVDLESDDVEVL